MYQPAAGAYGQAPQPQPTKAEQKEKKELLRAKVQRLVACYEDEKHRNEELTMEVERLRDQVRQQQQQQPAGAPPMGMPPQGFQFGNAPQPPMGGQPFGSTPQPPMGGQGYNLGNLGRSQPVPWQGGMPGPYGQPPANPYGQPTGLYPPPYGGADGTALMIQQVVQTIEQVRAKLHQAETLRGPYGNPQQPICVDYDTVGLLDKLYEQLGELSRELTNRRQYP
ncbi:MAG: hypothetical protein LBG83_06140 [Oscillospiraceae bacterium]|jgi:hypothetical protein|nr:hypothetical protein [Oscillospiraceae bacterium]